MKFSLSGTVPAVLVGLALTGCTGGDPVDSRVPDPPFVKEKSRERTGVVVILIDALRTDHLGVYGSNRGLTPNLDALARKSHVFENAIATSSWTRASVGSLLTSRYPTALGIRGRDDRLDDSTLMLSEILRDYSGFKTFAVSTNGNTEEPFGFAQGYDEFISTGLRRSYPGDFPVPIGEGVTQQATRLLDEIGDSRDFFMFLHYVDPHMPYLPHPGLLEDPEPQGRFEGSRRDIVPMDRATPEALTPADYDRIKHLYAGEVKYCDLWVGRFLNELEARGMSDEVMIVVTADHGEGLWDHGYRGHGKDLFEESIRVPLLVHYPGMGEAEASRIEQPVSLVDVAPTILAALDIPNPPSFQGADLQPVIRGEDREPAREYVFSELGLDGYTFRSIRYGQYKLIAGHGPEGSDGETGSLLFDLESDPTETKPLKDAAHLPVNLRAALRKWSLGLLATSVERQRIPLAQLDRDTLGSLRALGYIGASEHDAAIRSSESDDSRSGGEPTGLSAEEIKSLRPSLEFSARLPAGRVVRGFVPGFEGGEPGVRMGDAAEVFLARHRAHTVWWLDLAVDLRADEKVAIGMSVDGGPTRITRIHESGWYSLRGTFEPGGAGPVRLDLTCQREPQEPESASNHCITVFSVGIT